MVISSPDTLAEIIQRQQTMVRRRWANATRSFVEFPRASLEASISERFEQTVGLHGNRTAVQSGPERLTYAALNESANRLARTLVERLGCENEPVALLLEAGAGPIIAILGAVKAGKIYVSLDPTHPPARLRTILQDSQTQLIVTNRRNLNLAEEIAGPQPPRAQAITILNIDALNPDVSGENLGKAISPDTLAAIFYTSGSTGQPKGVVQTHRNFLYRVLSGSNPRRLCKDDRQPLLFSCSYAMSAAPITGTLLTGATLITGDLKAIGIGHLAEWLIQNEVTLVALTPSMFRQLVETLPDADERRFQALRLLILGGEPTTRHDIALWKRHFAPDCILEVAFGGTETMNMTRFFFDKESPIPDGPVTVGYPESETEILLLDERGGLVANGQVGEIAVRSRFLSHGYWRKPELTDAVFRPDPQGDGQRIYFTGDYGRFRSDRLLEVVGRKDLQVKIRGHAVQLAEVETALYGLQGIREAAVIAQPIRDGESRLIAYVASREAPLPTTSDLHNLVSQTLPSYMIPARFIVLDTLPHSASGKIDRQALPSPGHARPDLGAPFATPRNELEARLADSWAELLELDEVGINDNFFELGGDSITAMRMILEIEKLSHQTIPPEYFRNPTIAMLAPLCEPGSTAGECTLPSRVSRPELTSSPSRRMARLIGGQIGAIDLLRRAIENQVLRLTYERGLRWLAWVGQSGIAGRLFRDERRIFDILVQDLGYPASSYDGAFRLSVVGNVIWLLSQRTWSNTSRPQGDVIDGLRSSPALFWQSYADRIDHATNESRGNLIRFTGLEFLYHSQKQRRGTILVTYHSPATMIGNALLSRYTGLGHIPTISQVQAGEIAERESTDYDREFREHRSGWSASFALQGAHILRQGGVVQILNDVSYVDSNSKRKSIGGRSYDLKPGFAELALATGATVLPVLHKYDLTGCVHLTFLPALRLPDKSAAHICRVDNLLDQYVAFLENTWRNVPESVGWGSLRRFTNRPPYEEV